ncbi:MAG: hypothetical protein ACD_75C02463G0001 [uncultured bacterium]|nr:MAG: hypothetical protein ACD_75C02463G0001 [uncultured bacterium]
MIAEIFWAVVGPTCSSWSRILFQDRVSWGLASTRIKAIISFIWADSVSFRPPRFSYSILAEVSSSSTL